MLPTPEALIDRQTRLEVMEALISLSSVDGIQSSVQSTNEHRACAQKLLNAISRVVLSPKTKKERMSLLGAEMAQLSMELAGMGGEATSVLATLARLIAVEITTNNAVLDFHRSQCPPTSLTSIPRRIRQRPKGDVDAFD